MGFVKQDGLGNTRPERTTETGLRVLVDWVQATFFFTGDYGEVFEVLGLSHLDFEHFGFGRDTFTEMMKFSNITVMKKEEFTYRLVLSGQGCREYETFGNFDWIQLFTILRSFSADFRRIDIAIDDFGGHYSVSKIRECFRRGNAVTRMQEYDDRTKRKVSTGALTMDSIHLGSMESRLSINFYDKKLERENKKGANLEVIEESWTRTELRCKREYANQAIDMILLHEHDLGKVAFGILSKNLRFISNYKVVNKRKARVAKWWSNFIGKVDKLHFSLKAPDKTIERTKQWHKNSVAPSMAMLKKAFPTEDEFYRYINELVEDGNERLNDVHENMIKQYHQLRFHNVNKMTNAIYSPPKDEVDYENLYKRVKTEKTLSEMEKVSVNSDNS